MLMSRPRIAEVVKLHVLLVPLHSKDDQRLVSGREPWRERPSPIASQSQPPPAPCDSDAGARSRYAARLLPLRGAAAPTVGPHSRPLPQPRIGLAATTGLAGESSRDLKVLAADAAAAQQAGRLSAKAGGGWGGARERGVTAGAGAGTAGGAARLREWRLRRERRWGRCGGVAAYAAQQRRKT
jgi:hypothetical protein